MSSNAQATLKQLKASLPGNVITPDDEAKYKKATLRPWSQICWTLTAGYVQPENTSQLKDILAVIRENSCSFAVRSTGHNHNPGFSSTGETGIVVDLSQLRGMELGPNGVAKFGAGHTWGEVYTWLEGQGLSAIGGRDPSVGLGGFLLGGGMGALPNLHGLGGDGVENFEILLADGRIVNANAKENADLFKSLKGGGTNFGIVTRFDLQTHPLIKIQSTIDLHTPDKYAEVIKATIQIQEAMEKDPKIGLFTNFQKDFIAVGTIYAEEAEQQPAVFEPFKESDSLMMNVAPTSNGTLSSLAKAMAHRVEDSMKRKVWTVTTGPSQSLYEGIYKKYREVVETIPAGAVLHLTVQPIGALGVKAGKDRGNILGLEGVPQSWWVFTCEWPQDSDDAAAENAVDTLAATAKSLADKEGKLLKYLCMTFATHEQDVINSYGPENFKELKQVAAKYDPDGVFQKLQHGGFLLKAAVV